MYACIHVCLSVAVRTFSSDLATQVVAKSQTNCVVIELLLCLHLNYSTHKSVGRSAGERIESVIRINIVGESFLLLWSCTEIG